MEMYLLLTILTFVFKCTIPTLSVSDKYFENQFLRVNQDGYGKVRVFARSLYHMSTTPLQTIFDSKRSKNKRRIMKPITSMTPKYPETYFVSNSMKADVQTPKTTAATVTMEHPSHVLVPQYRYLPMLESINSQEKLLKENPSHIYSLSAETAENNRDFPTHYNTLKYTLVQATPLFPPQERKLSVNSIRPSIQPLQTSTIQTTRILYPKKPTLVPLTPLPKFKNLFYPEVLKPQNNPTTSLIPVTSNRSNFKKIIHAAVSINPLSPTHSHKIKKSNSSSTKMNRPLYPVKFHPRKSTTHTKTALEPIAI